MRRLTLVLVCLVAVLGMRATPAEAFNPIGAVCGVANLTSGLLGKACNLATGAGHILGAGKQLLGGHIGSAFKTLVGQSSGTVGSGARAALSLAAIGVWVLGGARFALHETAKVLSEATTPQLTTSWFSATYWRVAAIAALLTLPFLFAAAVQALVHSDLALLLRAVLGYLPLAMLAVAVAAPVTMLLLSASDELSGLVSSAAGHPGSRALALGGVLAGGLSALTGSPFLIFFLGLLTVAGAMALWMEMLMREAAVYVVVLMLPLAFSALVWPARRVWAIRAVELLIALILSKFAIVAVLSLGGAAMDQVGHSITAPIVGLVLVMMGAFAPWVLLRLVPLSELGAGALESLRGHGRTMAERTDNHFARALNAEAWATTTTAEMRRGADEAMGGANAGSPPLPDAHPSREARGGAAGSPDGEAAGSPDAPEAEGDVGELDGYASDISAGPAVMGTSPGHPTEGEGAQRMPGLSDMWQADDLTWRPWVLGTDEGWPPRVWPPGEDAPESRGVQSGAVQSTAAQPGAAQPDTPVPDGPPSDGLEGLPAPETRGETLPVVGPEPSPPPEPSPGSEPSPDREPSPGAEPPPEPPQT